MDTGIQVAAMVVIASFAIDRVTGGTFFLLSLLEGWNRLMPEPALVSDPVAKLAAQKRQKLVYYSFVCLLAVLFVFEFDIGVLRALNLNGYSDRPLLDRIFSVLVLMGGSDQIAALLKSPHAGKALDTTTTSKPIEVTGKLTLEDNAPRAVPRQRAAGE